MRSGQLLFNVGILCLTACAPVLRAAEPVEAVIDPAKLEFFEKNVRPLLTERCYSCHSAKAEKLKGGLLLDNRDGVLKGGDGGPAIVAGEPDKSRLIQAVRWKNDKLQMPPKERLKPEQIAILEQWVKEGAVDPRVGGAAAPKRSSIDFDAGKKFWSFQPIADPKAPETKDATWPIGDIDRFILAPLEARGLRPNTPTDKTTLLRRATFDLTGLPPTPEEVNAFLKDDSSDAFAKVVDRLLASPAYGERWGRHWLDLVRYADTSGCNSDYPIPSAYRYRDYVIASFNQDKPFDQFIREQLAGDLMADADASKHDERVIATGYLAIARRFGSRNAENHLTREDEIDNLGKTFLGLSVSCARCHDHKFDPISNEDYYALYGILNSTKYAFPGTEIYRHTKDFVALGSPAQAEALAKWEKSLADLDDKVENLGNERAKLKAKQKAGQPAEENGRTLAQVQAELLDVKQEMEQLERKPPEVEKAYAVTEGKPANAKIQRKGDPNNLGDEVPRGFLTVLGGQKLDPDVADKASGRLQLAGWIADAKNPLTARVMVNRIWQRHFGRGLVATPNDFGVRGRLPTHPELLDHLATRFIQSGWSIKAMHREIMLSRTYQMSDGDNPSAQAADPTNELHWRFDQRRLSAEEIRDAMLMVAGALDRSPAGPHPFPPEAEWRYTQHKPFFPKMSDYDDRHRSVYLMQQRIRKHPFLAVFDGADTNASTPDRALSTTPIQALYLMNDPFVHDMADRLAVRVGMAFSSESERVNHLFRLALSRPAAPDDLRAAIQYLRDCESQLEQSGMDWEQRPRAALASLARVVMSGNEFLFVD